MRKKLIRFTTTIIVHDEDGHDHHGHTAVLSRLLKIVQSTGLRTRFYDPVIVPEASSSGSQVNPLSSLSQEHHMAKKQQHEDSVETDELSATVNRQSTTLGDAGPGERR